MQDLFQQKALKQIEILTQKLINDGFSVSKPDKKLYNYEIIVNSNTEQAKLLVYFGKKGIKNVIQANPEQKLSKDLQDKEQILSQRVQFEKNQIAQESQSQNDSLIQKVKTFVKDYGKKNGYSYILGSNDAGSVMYGEEASDLTQTILEALNAEYEKE